jgi:hypothetical protein
MMERAGSRRSILDQVRTFLRFENPGVVHFAITNQCDLRCRTCRFWKDDGPGSVDYHDACTAIDVLHGWGVRMLSITGGEPLLHPHLVDICKHVARRGMMVSYLPTNGGSVTEDKARELARAGVNIVGISVDPLHSDASRRTRDVAPGQVRDARETLEYQGLRTYAGVLLTRDLLPLSRCLGPVRDMGFRRVVFSYPQTDVRAPYRASGHHPMLDLDADYVGELVTQIERARRSFPVYNPAPMLDDLVRAYRGTPQRHPCLGGERIFYLDWDLQLRRCFAEPTPLGNVLDMEDLPRGNGTCTGCTQQAFRDMSYVLTAYDRVRSVMERVRSVGNRTSGGNGNGHRLSEDLRVLFQLYLGGFV